MKTEAQEIAARIEYLLASDQWMAITNSFASRMDVATTTSLSMDENLGDSRLYFLFNFEKRESGLILSTYGGKIVPDVDGKRRAVEWTDMDMEFNAEGKYVFDFREAINLLEGRAVLKPYVSMDGVAKEGWFMADKNAVDKENRFYFTGGQTILDRYDLEVAINKLPLADLTLSEKTGLIRSLESGDLQVVKLNLKGKKVSRYIQASPETEGISIIDHQVKELNIGKFSPMEKKKQGKVKHTGLSMN